MEFELVPSLQKKDFIMDLKLSRVLFEDNSHYPWIFLVPRKNNVKNMMNLTTEERLQLMKEMEMCEKIMFQLFPCDQTNVAMIGNKTPQLHVHIICRKEGDPDWPGTVWGNAKQNYSLEEKSKRIALIKTTIEKAI